MGQKRLKERFSDPTLQICFEGLFPRDDPRNSRSVERRRERKHVVNVDRINALICWDSKVKRRMIVHKSKKQSLFTT